MASKYRKKYTLPENFYNVLEDYSREVLRDQPVDIVEFSYLYFKAIEEVSISFTRHFVGNHRPVQLSKKGQEHPSTTRGDGRRNGTRIWTL